MLKPLSICLAAFVLVGCSDNKSDKPVGGATNATSSASSGNPLTAPVDYLAAAGRAQQTATKVIDTTSVDKAIQLFNVDKGRNPKDLNELVQEKYLPQVPTPPYGTKLVYDANAGTVKIVKQ